MQAGSRSAQRTAMTVGGGLVRVGVADRLGGEEAFDGWVPDVVVAAEAVQCLRPEVPCCMMSITIN